MCFDCILENWSNTSELEKSIKLFPKKNRVRYINDHDGIVSKVLFTFVDHVVRRHRDECDSYADVCDMHDNPHFVYFDFKSKKYYNTFLKELKNKDYAYLYGKYKII